MSVNLLKTLFGLLGVACMGFIDGLAGERFAHDARLHGRAGWEAVWPWVGFIGMALFVTAVFYVGLRRLIGGVK